MILLLRILPILTAFLQAGCFLLQKQQPGTYPMFALAGVLSVPAASFLLSLKRVRIGDLVEKMMPTFILHLSLAFGLLLAEGGIAVWIIATIGAVSTFMSLELLFLLAYRPAAYPMNGLSRVNIAYVPIAIWYAAATSAGFMVFMHTDWYWHVGAFAALGGILFRTTGHPGATRHQNIVWTFIGFLAGAEIGWIGLLLPVSMGMQGFVAAILFTGTLRIRRHLYDPKPSKRMAWAEAVGATSLFFLGIFTAKWL